MEFNQNYEKLFFNYSLVNPKYLLVTRDGFYSSKELDILAYLAKKFYDRFKETPSREQMRLLVQNSSKAKDVITDSMIDLVFESNISDFDQEWLQRTAESWIKWRALNSTDVAFIDSGNDSLRVYRWDGSTWTQLGSGLSISEIGPPLS